MRHIKVTISSETGEARDILIALLSEQGYDGFEEEADHLLAYIPEDRFDTAVLNDITNPFGFSYATEAIEPQNWNELWESGFEPVVVEGFCTIRADFHNPEIVTPYVVVITPKMSFGTGHHATTQLMMMGMKDMDFVGKSVLDFGTGTGVLAILAEMLGATAVMAIDNDEWSVENGKENLVRNESRCVELEMGTLTEVAEKKYDIILANINRNILLQYMWDLYGILEQGGTLLMSGLLAEDEGVMVKAATDAGFIIDRIDDRNGWISISCLKMER